MKTLDFRKDSDNVRYDSLGKKIYVGYGEDQSGTLGIIDATTYEHLKGDYNLGGGHPEHDAHSKRVYVIGGEEVISVFQQRDPDHSWLKSKHPLLHRRTTGFYFTTHDTDRLYVAVPSHAGQVAELWVYEVQDWAPRTNGFNGFCTLEPRTKKPLSGKSV